MKEKTTYDLIAEEKDERRKEYWHFVSQRGVYIPCSYCHGLGTRTYGSTATWYGGIGGAAMTTDVCDKCWGSGDASRSWVNLRKLKECKCQEDKK